jgi:hypothetical protein
MESLAQTLLSPCNLTTKAVNHGRVQEQEAVQKFSQMTGLTVQRCGLFIDVANPHLAATPDGHVVEEDALLEIKCPYNGRASEITTGKHFPFLEIRDKELKLKLNHSYYYQVQGQMKICQKKACYFVMFTLCDIFAERIEFDTDFFDEKMSPFLQTFYDQHYLPHVVKSL